MSALEVLAVATLLIGLAAFYLVVLRPVLRSQHYFEARFYGDSIARAVRGFRTMMIAWALAIASTLVELYDWIAPLVAGQDWTPLSAKIPSWVWPLLMLAVAVLFRWLRKITSEPEPSSAPVVGSVSPSPVE